MKKMITRGLLVATVLSLSACVQYSLVPANTAVQAQGFTVTPGSDWNKSPFPPGPKVQTWTTDGEQLNQLMLIGKVSEGESLFKSPSKSIPMPSFKSDMLPFDIEALVRTSLKNLAGGELTINTQGLKPAKFGEQNGFRFEVSYFTQQGLLKHGDVLAAIKDEQLYLMIFTAAKTHYYQAQLPEVEQLFQSAIL